MRINNVVRTCVRRLTYNNPWTILYVSYIIRLFGSVVVVTYGDTETFVAKTVDP